MQINRRANMMLGRLVSAPSQAVSESGHGNLLWGAALLSATAAGFFCYQASVAPENASEAWVAYDSDMSEMMEMEASNIVLTAESGTDEQALEKLQALEKAIRQEMSSDPVVAIEESQDLPAVVEVVESSIPVDVSVVSDTESMNDFPLTSHDWVMANNGYTIQVLATPEEGEAIRVADQYLHSHVVHLARQHKSTYVVLVGEFSQASDARTEIQHLVEGHPNTQPWVRTFSQVRDDVDELSHLEESSS